MSVSSELRIQRRVTLAFIRARPFSVTLVPLIAVKDSEGYTETDGPPRAPQIMRLIDQTTQGFSNIPGKIRSAQGQERKVTHQLVGTYDSQMAVGDHWIDGNARFQIDEMLPENDYERRAQVVRYGL